MPCLPRRAAGTTPTSAQTDGRAGSRASSNCSTTSRGRPSLSPARGERFANYVPLLELVALEENEVIIRDNKKDRIVEVRAKRKLKLCCALDRTDYCPHTAFAGAVPQVTNAIRR